MSLAPGTRIGGYEVVGLLGTGGMGEVYRAHDTKLQRDVALKVLSERFTADPERLARFEREAQALAALSHPNIAGIYGFEELDAAGALVMELVEGPTLADVIAGAGRGLPLDDVLSIAKQIAGALEAAHEQGVVHCDLKPANIKLRPDGAVKVLDFGLAQALTRPGAGEAHPSDLPTVSLAATQPGAIFGTPAYMAPEQVKGRPVDRRADLWAFGCVLYEMLTRRRAFEAEDVSDTLAAVLRGSPDWNLLPASTPTALRRLLRRCLEKDPKQRLRDAGDALVEIEEALAALAGRLPDEARPARSAAAWNRTMAAFGAAVVSTALIAGTLAWLAARPPAPRVARLTIAPAPAALLVPDGITRDVAISPDGTQIAYRSAGALVVRALDELAPAALTRLQAPRHPAFSPDGRWIAVFDGVTSLQKVAAGGGPPMTLARIGGPPRGVSWIADDTIVFATADPGTGLLRVGAEGGEPEVLTRPDRAAGEVNHLWPEPLPGGRAVLFTVMTAGGLAQAQVAVLDLATRETRVLLRGGSHAQYVAPGYLVYGDAGGTLWAVRFNRTRLQVVGTPVPVVRGVRTTAHGAVNASVATDGTLAYVPGGATTRTMVWVDRQGEEEPLGAPARVYGYPRLSPDGARVAVTVTDQETDIWLWDAARETLTRLTSGAAQDTYPIWTPDGRRLVWASGRAGPNNLYTQEADGTGPVERLTESPNPQFPTSITPDGTRIVLREDGRPGAGSDLMLLLLAGGVSGTSPVADDNGESAGDASGRVRPLLATPSTERNGEVSPDGRWLAYESDESGTFEVYVRPFPDVEGGRWQVSTGGGTRPLWARSGTELFYRDPDGAVMGVTVDLDAPDFRAEAPTRVVGEGYFGGGSGAQVGRTYDVAPDGGRFLMIKEDEGPGEGRAAEIVVVLNWVEELKRLAP